MMIFIIDFGIQLIKILLEAWILFFFRIKPLKILTKRSQYRLLMGALCWAKTSF